MHKGKKYYANLKRFEKSRIREVKNIERISKDKFFTKLRELGFNSYKEYLQSDAWKNKKKKMFSSSIPKICYCCEAEDKPLVVHHKKYKAKDLVKTNNFGSFVFLCDDCHKQVHYNQKNDKGLTIKQATNKLRKHYRKIKLLDK